MRDVLCRRTEGQLRIHTCAWHANLTVIYARYLPNDSCEFVDIDDKVISWPARSVWAEDWLNEARREEHGPAHECINAMTGDATEGVVAVLSTLAEQAAADPDELARVGAGPLEDLLSHSGNGEVVLDEVEQVARERPAFRTALSNVWLSEDVSAEVRHRLAELGARDFVAEHAMSPEGFAAYEAKRDALGWGWEQSTSAAT